MRREVAANQPHQAQQAELPENPNFNWGLLKLPAETKFPVPVFLARLPAWHLRAVPSSTCILQTGMRARDGAECQSIASSHQQLLSKEVEGIPCTLPRQPCPSPGHHHLRRCT